MNETYRDLVLNRALAAVGAARAAKGITHRGLKGEIREILVRELFRPLLPADIGVGTGEIISHTGQTSSQTDIILYDRRILPPILFEQATGIFPIESVLETVEVKSLLNGEELRKANEAGWKLSGFEYAPGYFDESGLIPIDEKNKPLPPENTLLALETELSSEALRERLTPPAGIPGLGALCLIDRGFWLWKGKWLEFKPTYEGAEVVDFIGCLMNSYGRISASRGMPRLGRYVIPERKMP